MCLVKTPKIPDPATDPNQTKPLPVIRNPLLDGLLGNIAANGSGRNSLRIALNPLGIPVAGSSGGVGGASAPSSSPSSSSSSDAPMTSGGGRYYNYKVGEFA